MNVFFFFSSRRRHTRYWRDWSSDVCSSDLGSWHALVGVDMPFGSYEGSPEQAFASASRMMKETGCAAVKLEGGEVIRSEERRVGKECRSRGEEDHYKKK